MSDFEVITLSVLLLIDLLFVSPLPTFNLWPAQGLSLDPSALAPCVSISSPRQNSTKFIQVFISTYLKSSLRAVVHAMEYYSTVKRNTFVGSNEVGEPGAYYSE